MEMIQKYDVGKPFKIRKPFRELLKHHYRALHASCAGRLNRHPLTVFERRADHADRLNLKGKGSCLCF